MKKLASLLLVFALALSLAVPCFAVGETGITVQTPPNKTTYTVGEKFDPKGMHLSLNYDQIPSLDIDVTNPQYSSSIKYEPSLDTKLTEGINRVTITYAVNGQSFSASQEITVSPATSTPAPSPTPAPDTSAAPFISSYAITDAGGAEKVEVKKGDTFTLVLRVVDNALAAYDNVDASNVAAKINSAAFTFTGLAEVSQFESGQSEGKPFCSYVLIFRDVIFNGGGNSVQVDISYKDTTRPVSSLTQVLAACDDAAARTPGLIVRDVNYGGTSITAGQSASLTLSVFATTGNEDLSDVMVSLSLPEGVTLSSGSQTTYLGSMKSGGLQTATFNLLPSATFTGGVANITVNLSGVGKDSGTSVSGSSTVSIPVLQPERFEITNVESPDAMMLGEEGYISVTFVNKGKTSINNLSAEISGDNLANPGQSQFVGNIAAGTENSVDFDVAALETGTITGIITLSYEDSTGAAKTLTTNYSITVNEMPAMEDPGMTDPGMMEPEAEGGLPVGVIVVIVIVAAGVIALVVRIVLKKRKAKALAALGEDDEDL